MAREKKPLTKAQKAYNARRRYYRQAQRYLNQSRQAATFSEKARYFKLAERSYMNAIDTYARPIKVEKSKTISKQTKGLVRNESIRTKTEFLRSNDFFSDLTKNLRRSKPIRELTEIFRPATRRKTSAKEVSKLIEESEERATIKGMSEQERRTFEAREILKTQAGHRIYGAFVDQWKNAEDREAALMKYFGADDLMEVIEIIEQAGLGLYDDIESEMKYDEVRTSLERYL